MALARPEQLGAGRNQCTTQDLAAPASFWAFPGQAKKISYDETTLDLSANSVATPTNIRISPLCKESLPTLDTGMTNVTKAPRHGYRFQPHKMEFNDNVAVKMPYDKTLIPSGLTEQDIKTFYFDDQAGTWKELQRVEVNLQTQTVTSLTNHFTDMINATVTVPDHPQPLSYSPTSIKDIKAADPGAGVNLIAPPEGTSSGDARLSYPIEIPPGRQGMQPQLAISYNSSGGNGWVGLGWDLPAPAIMIDTRWGVPRYDATNQPGFPLGKETETYLLDGEMLTPVAHRGALQPRSVEKEFHTRVEGQFRKIIRHEDGPASYWWEVTDKEGTRFFFGGDPDTGALTSDSVLKDGAGNVFKWALREVLDTHGNGIRYTYTTVTDTGVDGGLVDGHQLYLTNINYTQSNGADGAYDVIFIRDSELPGYTRRPDVQIDARGGFKMVTAELLKRIEVKFNNGLVRAYDLEYQLGAFEKTLLESVTQRGEDNSVFNTHEFTYFDDIRDGGGAYHGFAASAPWNTRDDSLTAGLLGQGRATALGGFVSENVGGHIYVGFNPTSPTKQFSGGGKVGFNFTAGNETLLALVDINGDNLPDKVFKSGGSVRFRLNQSGPDGGLAFGDAHPIPTLTEIGKEGAFTFSFGAEAYFGVSVLVNHARTFTDSSIYFADANGDGLTDLVSGGTVLFNRLDGSGIPTFSADSSTSPVPVDAGAVDANGIIPDYGPQLQEALDNFPLQDTVRRWEAPWDGDIKISGGVTLAAQTHATADGVRVAIQHDGSELWSAAIGKAGGTVTPSGVDSVNVNKGDDIYFRVQSVFDGTADAVSWDPLVEYLGVSATNDVNLRNVYRYKASEDFTLGGRPSIDVQVPYNGTVRLSGDLHKLGVTTDDVTLLVLKNGVTVSSQTLNWDQTGDIATNVDIAVAQNDRIKLRVKVDSPVDVSKLQWKPNLFYVAVGTPAYTIDGQNFNVAGVQDSNGDYIIQLHPPYDIDLYPDDGLTALQTPLTVPFDATITVTTQLASAAHPDATGTVNFTVKKPGELLAKKAIPVFFGAVANTSFTLDVEAGDKLFFDYSAYNPKLKLYLSSFDVNIDFGFIDFDVPATLHSAQFQGVFPNANRGWAVAGYRGSPPRDSQPLVESDFDAGFDSSSTYDPRTAKVYLYTPFPEDDSWRGPEAGMFAKAASISSSRLGPDYFEVPVPGKFAGGRAVSRQSFAQQTAGQVGVAFLSGSLSGGSSDGEVDYVDMNGDRFPDIVGNGRIQYTTMTGGLEGSNTSVSGFDRPRSSDNSAKNFGIGGSPANFKASSKGEVDRAANSAPKGEDTGAQMQQLGIFVSGGLSAGDSDVKYDLMDINGDGLPDRVRRDGVNLRVRFNLGYSFAAEEPWDAGAINDGSSHGFSLGGGVSFNGGIYDFAGGVSFDKNESETAQTLLDINGDGLLDRLFLSGGALMAAFNTGNGFTPPTVWGGAFSGIAENGNVTLGGGVYFTLGIPLCGVACYIIINPGVDGGQSIGRQELGLMDVDGDGYPDHVNSSNDAGMNVAQNRTARTNLLQTITRPMGAVIELDYERDGNTYDLPQSRWVLTKVRTFDGFAGDGQDYQLTTYKYEGGFYNRLEREFYGYAKLTSEHRDEGAGAAVYRRMVREYFNDSYYNRSLLRRERTEDAAGNPFTETENTYLLLDIDTGLALADPQSTTGTVFPELVRTDERFFEGDPAPGKATHTTNEYDALGNLIHFFDAADVGVSDDVEVDIAYSSCAATYIVATPIEITVRGNGVVMRHRTADIDCATGDISKVTQFLENGDVVETALEYFANGNLKRVMDPPNLHGLRYELQYEYDSLAQTHNTRIEDSFGYFSTAEYNLKYGHQTKTPDINGNVTSYTYDVFGRASTVTGPYQEGGPDPTVSFEYHHNAAIPWALTHNLDTFRDPADPIDTVIFADGLKRVLQTKKDAAVFTAPDSAAADVMTVSGRVTFDFVNRPIEQFYPLTESLGTPGVFNPAYDAVPPTRTTYDVLERVTSSTIPDGTVTATAHGFGLDRNGVTQFETTITDGNGIQKKTYKDLSNTIVSLKEFNNAGAQVIWTSYEYDPLDQLIADIDDAGNVTRISYDNLGRRLAVDSPDSGKTETVYDLDSNMIASVSANLRAESKQISYDYEFNRMVSITYPNRPENNVTYAYGGPGASQNRAGRISEVTDESGKEEWFFGRLGEIVKEIKTVNSDTQGKSSNGPEVYTTEYVYDTFARLQTLKYPDGEVLTYSYDSGGMLQHAAGQKGGHSYLYLNRLEYDKFSQRAFVEAGNEVRTHYTYDALDRRLNNLNTGKGSGNTFQNISYVYDNVGNALSLANAVAVPSPSQYGGPTTQTFIYDDLYRLTNASGTWQFNPDKSSVYSMNMSFDTIHNSLSKQQSHHIVQPSGIPIRQHKTSYNFAYDYGDPRPHAATHIGDRTFSYDANGNQLGWDDDRNGTRRNIVWDEENRIQSIFDNGHEKTYKYNDKGERVIKRGPQGETVYVNEFFTIRNREVGTKHVYAGETRFVSKLMKQDKPGAPPGGTMPLEKDLYFYHPDHIGSSNYVTDTGGRFYEHLEYFPSGETWVEESSNTQRTPYLFTSKELDEETGLYYYVARYYDPRTAQFQSADPLMQRSPEKSTRNSEFLALYTYAKNNPLKFMDPDGQDVIIAYGHGRQEDAMIAAANQLQQNLQAADPSLRGDRVRVVPIESVAQAAQEITAAGRPVSGLAVFMHGRQPVTQREEQMDMDGILNQRQGDGLLLPARGQGLLLRDVVNQAQVAEQGAVVAFACQVCAGVNVDAFRERQIRVYGMRGFARWGTTENALGRVAITPGRNTRVRNAVDPGQIQIGPGPGRLTEQTGIDRNRAREAPNTLQQHLIEAEQRVNRAREAAQPPREER